MSIDCGAYNFRSAIQPFMTGNKMAIYEVEGKVPDLDPTAWVADSAQVMGDVKLCEHASVWFGVIARGDSDRIYVGKRSNIQDSCVLHADEGIPLVIGDNVSVGHQVMLHGCTIGDGSLIGIGAVVLNRARIGRNCIVGAGALVTEGKEFPDGSMILGSPARAVKTLTPEQIQGVQRIAQHYVDNAKKFRATLKKLA